MSSKPAAAAGATSPGMDAILGTDRILVAEQSADGKMYMQTPEMFAVQQRITTEGRLVYTPDLKLCKWVVTVPTDAEEQKHPGKDHIIYTMRHFADPHLKAVAERLAAGQMIGYQPLPDLNKWVLAIPSPEQEAENEDVMKKVLLHQMLNALAVAMANAQKQNAAGAGAAAAAGTAPATATPAAKGKASKAKKNQSKHI